MATPANKQGTEKSITLDQLRQSIESTSNLLQLMQQSSPSQSRLLKLPKNLLEKAATIKNTGKVLHQMPSIISSFDANLENGLHSVPHLKAVMQLLANMEEICHPCGASQTHGSKELC